MHFNAHSIIFGYAFYYPLFMAWIWMIGGLWFYVRREGRRHGHIDHPPVIDSCPSCTILIPCMNEEAQIEQTVGYALRTAYPRFEVIVINDGSEDRTGEMLEELADRNAALRVIHLKENQGKAIALRAGALAAKSDYLVCIDGDALIHPHVVGWMMHHLVDAPRVGAVTGNPRILNRSSLLGKIQVGEFSSIIGLIKRAQRTYGSVFTVSGVIAGFKRAALDRVGYWDEEMITDDIDVSWRLQLDHWYIRYEPRALCYIYMPETLRGLWKQRLRWAQGGIEVLREHGRELFSWRQRRFWLVGLEYAMSVVWSYAMLLIFILFFVGLVFPITPRWYVDSLAPKWYGSLLGISCLCQFFLSLWMDRRYEHRRFLRNYFWVIWYPLVYWTLSMFTVVVAFPKTIFRKSGGRARWVSPDRGIQADTFQERK